MDRGSAVPPRKSGGSGHLDGSRREAWSYSATSTTGNSMAIEQGDLYSVEELAVGVATKLTEDQRIVTGVIKDSRKSDAALLGSVLIALAINTHGLRIGREERSTRP